VEIRADRISEHDAAAGLTVNIRDLFARAWREQAGTAKRPRRSAHGSRTGRND